MGEVGVLLECPRGEHCRAHGVSYRCALCAPRPIVDLRRMSPAGCATASRTVPPDCLSVHQNPRDIRKPVGSAAQHPVLVQLVYREIVEPFGFEERLPDGRVVTSPNKPFSTCQPRLHCCDGAAGAFFSQLSQSVPEYRSSFAPDSSMMNASPVQAAPSGTLASHLSG
jgi:hypothetical protein